MTLVLTIETFFPKGQHTPVTLKSQNHSMDDGIARRRNGKVLNMNAQRKLAHYVEPIESAAPKLPQSANDNVATQTLAEYCDELRVYAGADYVPARAKAWWLP